MSTYVTAILASLCLCACTSLPVPREYDVSFSPSQKHPGWMSNFLEPHLLKHPGMSGLGIVPKAKGALQARLAMATLAEHTLDLQYYIWHDGIAANLLLTKLLDASERGVRVRLLLDDHTMGDRDDFLARLDALPNFNIKLYNPYSRRRSGSFFRVLALLGDFSRLNHRMHNKLMVSDNQLAITGGRNIGNEYFGLSEERNFLDLDLFAVGPVVDQLSYSFDEYWNSNWAIRLSDFDANELGQIDTEALMASIRADLANAKAAAPPLPFQLDISREQLVNSLEGMPDALIWGLSLAASDPPRKDQQTSEDNESVVSWLSWLSSDAQHEILWASPYLVPSDSVIDSLHRLGSKGITVKFLTNSLASNDVGVAHYGYANRREDMLEAGAELYEFRPDAQAGHDEQPPFFSRVPVGLHAKVAVFDRRYVYIGSSNLDPRSIVQNTEIGLVVDNPGLAEEVAQWILNSMEGHSAYRVTLQEGGLCWQWYDGPVLWQECDEPDVGFWDGLGIWVVDILPIENQLCRDGRSRFGSGNGY